MVNLLSDNYFNKEWRERESGDVEKAKLRAIKVKEFKPLKKKKNGRDISLIKQATRR